METDYIALAASVKVWLDPYRVVFLAVFGYSAILAIKALIKRLNR
jgi:hypothetical protein